jgi:endonuclease III
MLDTLTDLPIIASLLKERYRDFDHRNPLNPLADLIFIICSVQTSKSKYERAYSSLRKRYPTFQELREASFSGLCVALAPSGLASQKARYIFELMRRLTLEFGRPTLSPLRSWSDDDCERFLCGLPGVGKKVARCVMLMALGRAVFPVDVHCWRISKRLGWICSNSRTSRTSPTPREMDMLQERIPAEHRYSLHVNFISLGREFCKSDKPDCCRCPIKAYCSFSGRVEVSSLCQSL